MLTYSSKRWILIVHVLYLSLLNVYSQGHSAYDIAENLYKSKSFDQCQIELDQILTVKKSYHDSTLAATYKLYGDLYLKKYELHETIKNYEVADSIYALLGKRHAPKRLNVINKIGICYAQQDNLIMTSKYFQSAYDLAISIYEHSDLNAAKAVNNLASVYLYLGDFDQSLKYYKESVAVKKKFIHENPVSLANTYENMASIYGQINQMGEAESYLNKAGQLYQMQHEGNKNALLGFYINLAGFYLENDRVDDAIQQLIIADSLPDKYKEDKLNVLLINKNFGTAYLEKKDYQRALQYFEKVKSQVNQFQVGQKDMAITYTHMAHIYAKQDRNDLASSALENARGIMLPLYSKTHKNYLELLQQQVQISLEMGDVKSVKILMEKYQAGLSERNQIKNTDLLFSNLKMGHYVMNLNYNAVQYKLAKNEKYLNDGIAIVKEVIAYQDQVLGSIEDKDSKLFFFKNAYTNFSTAIFLYLEKYKETNQELYLEKAFKLSEKAKFYALKEAKGLRIADFGSTISEELTEREKQLKIELSQITSRYENLLDQKNKPDQMLLLIHAIDSLKGEYDGLVHTIRDAYPIVDKQLKEEVSINIADASSYLEAKNRTYISYFLSGNELIKGNYAFVLNGEGLRVSELSFTSEQLDLEIAALSETLKQTDENNFFAYEKVSASMYDMLLSKVELVSSGGLVFNPHKKLHAVPFEVLKKEVGANFLIQDRSISYVYSISSFIVHEDANYDKPFLGCAPIFGKENQLGLIPLEYNTKELNGISNLLDFEKKTGIVSKQDFVEMIKNHSFNIIHFATHASANQKRGDKSYLAFGGDSTQLLYSREIYGLPIKADLVVLSACQSGDGELSESQGVLGLTTAFAATSTKSILASLWNVSDATTQKLMLKYYKYLKEGRSKDEALREAKLEYLTSVPKSKQHPYYWASFVQIGSIAPLQFELSYFSIERRVGLVLILFLLGLGWIYLSYNKKRAASPS